MGGELRAGLRAGQHVWKQQTAISGNGVGWSVGYTPCRSPLEVEIAGTHYEGSDMFGMDSPAQVSGLLYLFPDSTVSPILLEVSAWRKTVGSSRTRRMGEFIHGYHFGLGAQYRLSSISVRIEGRYLSYEDITDSTQIQGLVGIDYHF